MVKVDFQPFLSWLCERSAEKDFEKCRRLLSSSLFFDFEFGQVTPGEFARRLRALFGAEFSSTELEERFCSIFPGIVPGMDSVMEELAAAGPVYCLSNTNEIHLAHLRLHYPIMAKFSRVFASHELGQRKPYPAIYRNVARELNVAPSQLLFFDDVRANVEGALRAGLDAHLFSEAGQIRDRLKDFKGMDDKAYTGDHL